MSSSLPVPSKGALRALRHIALGTSCTVAFATGVITEDRRRRIHAVREVGENAQRIKTSRNYHSAGASVAAGFEQEALDYDRYGPWKEGDKPWMLEAKRRDDPPDFVRKVESKTKLGMSRLGPARSIESPDFKELRSYVGGTTSLIPSQSLSLTKVNENTTVKTTVRNFNCQWRLARALMGILGRSDPETVEAAAATFFGAFTDGLQIETLDKPLLQACMQLAETCERYNKVDTFIPILMKILGCGPLDEESFYALHAPTAIGRLLEQSGYRTNDQVVSDFEKLEEAVAMFRTKFREKPRLLPPEMRQVGIQLCTATLQAKLYDLTDSVYWRLAAGRADATPVGVDTLIFANHRRGCYKQVLDYFNRFFTRTQPGQDEFYAVVGAAVDSALQLGRLDKAEEVIHTASEMAKAGDLVTSTTWLLRLLGDYWRATRDLLSTQALFDRLEALIEHTSHPQAIYSAIIQFCVEADSETQVQQYLDRLKAINGGVLDVRTQGHLALAKAMRNDWEAVLADFKSMKSLARSSPSEHTAVFVPILKLFASSHDVRQVENFVHLYIEKLGVVPNDHIFNSMIGVYCKAGEMNSIPQWVEYMQRFGLRFDPVSFNAILTNCRNKWGMRFHGLFQLCERSKSTGGEVIDNGTIDILHRATRVSAGNNHGLAHKLQLMIRSLEPAKVRLDRGNTRKTMLVALAEGKPAKALRVYKYALRTKILIEPQAVALAVKASIQSTASNNSGPTVDLLKEARSRGFDIHPSMTLFLLHRMEISTGESENVESVVKDTLVALEKVGLEITLPVVTKAASVLVDRGRSREAIGLWNSLSNSNRLSSKCIDVVLLTVLLKAYLALFDYAGIQWVMDIISRNSLFPDFRFTETLKNARRGACRYAEANPSDDAKRRYGFLDRCVQLVMAQRSQGIRKREEAEKTTLRIMEIAAAMNASDSTLKESNRGFQRGSLNGTPRQYGQTSTAVDMHTNSANQEQEDSSGRVEVVGQSSSRIHEPRARFLGVVAG